MAKFFEKMTSQFYTKQLHITIINNLIKAALFEDKGKGDYTSLATIPKNATHTCKLLVKETGIIAGVKAAEYVIKHIDKNIKITTIIKDGSQVKPNDVVFTAQGNSQNLLLAERLLLNIMQRMSGIATKTNYFQMLCKNTNAKVIDTRKTTPNFRIFEKWAVSIGGGYNHRFGLYDMILIKDNHIDVCGSINLAIERTKQYCKTNKLPLKIIVEARNINDIKEILKHKGVHRILLDNFDIKSTKQAVKLINTTVETESSGNINERTISKYANCGVNYISIGALTHHINSLDLSFKVIS